MKQILILTLVLFCGAANGQPVWKWAISSAEVSSNFGDSRSNDIALDRNHNVYVTGYYRGTMNVGNTQLTATGQDIFVAKYSPDGQPIWVKNIGGTGDETKSGIAVDSTGNVYVAGEFSGSINTDNSILTSNGAEDIFLAKYDQAGNLQWAKRAGGTGSDGMTKGITESDGYVYMTGYFSDTASFSSVQLISQGSMDVFLCKYDEHGNIIWARNGGGKFGDRGVAVTTDKKDGIYVTGNLSKSSNVYFDTFKVAMTNSMYWDIFIVKYDKDGHVEWASLAGDINLTYSRDIALDNEGNSYIVSALNGDAIFAQFDNNGLKKWSKQMGFLYDASLATDPSGRIYLAKVSNTGMSVSKYDKQSYELWKKTANGGNVSSITANQYGNTFVTGSFYGKELHFDNHIVYNLDTTDFFVAKLDMFPVDVDVIAGKNSLAVYPNPNDGNFTIGGRGLNADSKIEVFNALGEMVYSSSTVESILNKERTIYLDVPNGVYLLRVCTGSEAAVTRLYVQR